MKIEIGPLSRKLSEQLKGVLSAERLAVYDAHASALNRCYVHSLLGHAEWAKACNRLMRMLKSEVAKSGKPNGR